MTHRLRLAAAASLLALATFGSAESIVARISRGSLATEVAQRQGLRLQGITADGKYARFEIPAGSDPSERLSAARKDRGLVAADFDAQFRTVQFPQYSDVYTRPTLVQKGSTIPVVGDRAALKVSNAALLGQINWSEDLAARSGRRVRVAMLDTGLADSAVGLWNKTVASRNLVEWWSLPFDQPTGRDSSDNGVPDEAVGHGTVVAGIIDLVAPQTQFIVVRIADSDGIATTWSLLQGIRFALDHGAEVINISLAQRKKSLIVEQALIEAEMEGATVVASIGNDDQHEVYEPAYFPTVLAVAGLDTANEKASFSNYHERANVAAPGTSVVGRYWTGEEIQWAGTSFSAAFVSGSIADILRRRVPASPRVVRWAIGVSGTSIDDLNPEYDGQLGKLLNVRALSRLLGGG